MANQEKELQRFVNEPKYREKVLKKIHRDQDSQYDKRIRTLCSEKDKLISSRSKEIKRITSARWESVVDGKLLVNATEGKVRINESEIPCSDIQGAELNVQMTYRGITNSSGESKKHVSLGGAVVGGLVGGGVGLAIGGLGLGKRKNKGTTVHNQVPVCTHLGVLVNIRGFVSEIVLLSKQVDQTSSDYADAERKAQVIISKLAKLGTSPMPTHFLRVEEEPTVRDYDAQIISKDQEIQYAIEDKPTYEIPDMYRLAEQREMSDEEYLSHLAQEDIVRAEALTQMPTKSKSKIAIDKDAILDGGKKTLRIIGIVCCWGLTIFTLIMALGACISGTIPGTILLIVSALSVNPLMHKLVISKVRFIRKWMCVLIFIVAFIIGILLIPTTTSGEDVDGSTETTIIDDMTNNY